MIVTYSPDILAMSSLTVNISSEIDPHSISKIGRIVPFVFVKIVYKRDKLKLTIELIVIGSSSMTTIQYMQLSIGK